MYTRAILAAYTHRILYWSTRSCTARNAADSDWLVGYADIRDEAWELLKEDTDVNGSGGWDYEYIQNFLKNWEE